MTKKGISIIALLLITGCCFAGNDTPVLAPAVLEAVTAYNLQQDKEYVEVVNRPLLILFSGCAGMGKTTTAKAIQSTQKTLRFDAYDTRVFLRNTFGLYHENLPAEEKLSKILSCFAHFLATVQARVCNKAIIFDESIDRNTPSPALFERIQAIAQEKEFPLFVIRLQVPREIAFKRLMKRESQSAQNQEHFKNNFDSYYDLYEAFDASRIHYILDNSENAGEPLSRNHGLMEAIALRITAQR